MPILQAFNITYQFDNGDTLFNNLSCTLRSRRTGLVGKNGVGKSLLARVLSGEKIPSSGNINRNGRCDVYRQQHTQLLGNEKLTIAAFLEKQIILNAIKRVTEGEYSPHYFDIIGDEWDLGETLSSTLCEIGIPADPLLLCSRLSGGQLAKLHLWKLFNSDLDILILDEPSNHLDKDGKTWLVRCINAFSGAILLISHDRELLNMMDEIWDLSERGLRVYGGNYTTYYAQKQTEQEALERQLYVLNKQKSQFEANVQKSKEKAQQRARQGNKLRKDGSQPKVLLDKKKDDATANASTRCKNLQKQRIQLNNKTQNVKERISKAVPQYVNMASANANTKTVVSLIHATLAFGNKTPLSIEINANDKIHISGVNGSGKSTLFKTLLGQCALTGGVMRINTPLYFLDQHAGEIDTRLTALENLTTQCQGLIESEARTLLAGAGLRGSHVFLPSSQLSGGQKMKLAMLTASQQPIRPFLLLDEPDNHLDLDAKIALASALNHYRGGYLLVSHDNEFVNECGINRTLML